jgi:hypothetical protein
MDDGFGIRARSIGMTCSLEIRAHVRVVVDFSVKGDPDVARFVGQRLMTAREIDNAQSAMSEGGSIVGVETRSVRTSIADEVAHRDSARAVVRAESVAGDDSCNATHVRQPSLARRIPTARPPHRRR